MLNMFDFVDRHEVTQKRIALLVRLVQLGESEISRSKSNSSP